MGWYESRKHPGVTLGDDAFDATYKFLKDLAAAYREGAGRNPTLAELSTLLQIELGLAGGEFLHDFQDQTITHVAIKAAKKPPEQRYGVGDVFAIPLEKARYAFGRILRLSDAYGMLVEIFAATSDTQVFRPSIATSGWLFQPLRLASGNECLKNWRWRVVQSEPNYQEPTGLDGLEYATPDSSGGWCAKSLSGRVLRERLSNSEAERMTGGHFWAPHEVEARIEEFLGKKR